MDIAHPFDYNRGMTMVPLDTLDASSVLARAEGLIEWRREVALQDLELVLDWADLHAGEPPVDVPGGDRLVPVGGDGTPSVRDLCLEELAIARGTHVISTRKAMADALDLRHRLPKLWAATRELACEVWLARKIATLSRKLSADRVGLVDTAVTAALAQAPGRVLAIAEATIIEADTEAHQKKVDEARKQRGVWISGTHPTSDVGENDAGVRTLVARIASADAVWIDATLTRVADALAADPDLRAVHHPDLPEDPSRDELRAAALGWLSRPHDLATLLRTLDDRPEQPSTGRRGHQGTVYVHLHEAALLAGEGVARVEAIGPVLVSHLAELLGHAHIDLKPVIDLNDNRSVNGYEHPTAMRERTHLRTAGDVFPHATGLSRRVDADHPCPTTPADHPARPPIPTTPH